MEKELFFTTEVFVDGVQGVHTYRNNRFPIITQLITEDVDESGLDVVKPLQATKLFDIFGFVSTTN